MSITEEVLADRRRTHKAAIYTRRSNEQPGRAEEQKSVRRQEERARAFAAERGWVVDDRHVYSDDGVSGAEFERRPGFMRMMTDLQPRAPFDVVIVSEQKSLGRESLQTGYVIKQLAQAGVEVWEYMDGRSLTPKNWMDKAMSAMRAAADEAHREDTSKRVHETHRRLAERGYVTGGRVFAYRNVDVYRGVDPHGRPLRSHVERQIVEEEAAVVRRIFQLCASGHGVRAITKILNSDGAPSPRSQQGRPAAWAPSSVWEVLHRELYRGVSLWNRSRKRDMWGQHDQQPRDTSEWLRREAPELRIVPEDLWVAATRRLDGAREDYNRRLGGRVVGRPVNGTESKYLLTGLAQCGACRGGLFVNSRKSGTSRRFVYGCSSYHLRGRSVCSNSQLLPMAFTDGEVLQAFREDLLDPVVLERALSKLEARLTDYPDTSAKQLTGIQDELRRVESELARLTAAVAAGGDLPSILDAVRSREDRRAALAGELAAARLTEPPAPTDWSVVLPVVQDRLMAWQRILAEETPQARQMLRTLLKGRIVFTPNVEQRTCVFEARGDYEEVFRGLVDLPKACASGWGRHTH